MKYRSKKEKGSRFERFVAKEIEQAGLGKAGREANSGAGFRKGDIASSLEFLIECKNQKSLAWWKAIDQAKKEAEIGNHYKEKWALVVRDPRTPEDNPNVYAVIDFWQMLDLLKKDSEPRVKEPDKNLRWKLETLKNSINGVLKELK